MQIRNIKQRTVCPVSLNNGKTNSTPYHSRNNFLVRQQNAQARFFFRCNAATSGNHSRELITPWHGKLTQTFISSKRVTVTLKSHEFAIFPVWEKIKRPRQCVIMYIRFLFFAFSLNRFFTCKLWRRNHTIFTRVVDDARRIRGGRSWGSSRTS